jgi:aldose 1-epimerase
MKTCLILLALPAILSAASRYNAVKTTDGETVIIRLTDEARGVEVNIAPSVGYRAYELKVHGKNLLYFPGVITAYKKGGAPGLNGVPFLAPWANRMAGGGFWANDKHYVFNPNVGTVRIDPNGIAIHGMLAGSPRWEVEKLAKNKVSASVTSKFDFWKYPDMMANWPFAQEYEITYTLTDGALEVATTIKNLSDSPMPVAIGFHPYFNIPDTPRSEETVHIAARMHVETDTRLVATGQLTSYSASEQVSLRDHTFDDGFTSLIRDGEGHATFSVQAGSKKIAVVYGPKYQVAVIYAPPRQNYICFEPMAAITNGVNLAHEGKYPDLQTVAPGASWQESFWIRFSGF